MAILIGLGANLPSAKIGLQYGGPKANCAWALSRLAELGVRLVRRSRWWTGPPVPPSDQPWYVNGVALIETELAPSALLARLHQVEAELGRVRSVANSARPLDLDLLDYDGRVDPIGPPVLPHPRLATRAFVLLPLAELVPDWRHPASGVPLADLIAALPADHGVVPID